MFENDRPTVSILPAPGGPLPAKAQRGGRGPWLAYLLVSTLSLLVGVGGTVAVLWATGYIPASGSPVVLRGSGASLLTGHEAHAAATADPASSGAAVADLEAGAYISPARQQLIGVRTAEAVRRTLETTIRTVGTLAYDETRIAQIHTKVAGWVERVFVDYVGKPVRRGQPLFSVYSPELVSTQHEYLLALDARERLGQSRFFETRTGAEALFAATRERLKLWDITDEQLAELERTRQPRRTLTLYSPFDGIVLERNAYPGQYITPETMTFRIADLRSIWVFGYVFEYELPRVKVGQEVEALLPYGGTSRTLKGKITYIYPDIDPITRRAKIRAEFPNPGFEFKPESYVTLAIRTSGGSLVAVPREAVIDTGVKQYVILARPGGYFQPRAVKVGAPVDEYYPVYDGLQPGDRVVTSAQFLIDSEANLQAALQAMTGGAESAPAVSTAHGAHLAAAPPLGASGAPPAGPGVDVGLRTRPDPPQMGENTFEVTVRDARGQPVTDASVEVVLFMPPMPSMGMPAMRSRAVLTHAGGGVYRGTGEIRTAGRWKVTVTVRRGSQVIGHRQTALVVQ